MILGPLLSEASVHANTAGVFKGFYKDVARASGSLAAAMASALADSRPDTLAPPVLSRFECDVQVMQADANCRRARVSDLDLAYIDPPYNQHPYGSNYFMLNLLVHYQRPKEISKVSGIPTDWRRSGYNTKHNPWNAARPDCIHSTRVFCWCRSTMRGSSSPTR